MRRDTTAARLAEKLGVNIKTVVKYTAQPRPEYLANSLSRQKPWEALGMSRATWYRRGKPMPPSPENPADSPSTSALSVAH